MSYSTHAQSAGSNGITCIDSELDAPHQADVKMLAVALSDIVQTHQETKFELERSVNLSDNSVQNYNSHISPIISFVISDLTGKDDPPLSEHQFVDAMQTHRPTVQELDGIVETLKTLDQSVATVYSKLSDESEISAVALEKIRRMSSLVTVSIYSAKSVLDSLTATDTQPETTKQCSRHGAVTVRQTGAPVRFCPHCGSKLNTDST